jgi:hypothetical protein
MLFARGALQESIPALGEDKERNFKLKIAK